MSTCTWFTPGAFSRANSKGYTTTSWVFDLHSSPHDFDSAAAGAGNSFSRKVFSSNISHVAVVLLWLSGMHFHGGYFSNYSAWLIDPTNTSPSAQVVSEIVGQGDLNGDVGGYFQGIYVTSGLFNLWRSSGIISVFQLKCMYLLLLTLGGVCILGTYFHMNFLVYATPTPLSKIKSVSLHHVLILLGLGSIAWSGHLVHVAIPVASFLDSGVFPAFIPTPNEFLYGGSMSEIYANFGLSLIPDFSWSLPAGIHVLRSVGSTSPLSASFYLGHLGAHHFYLGAALVIGGSLLSRYGSARSSIPYPQSHYGQSVINHASLSLGLGIVGSLSFAAAHHLTAMPLYPFFALDYPTHLCSFVHHVWVGMFLIVGSASHAAIHLLREYSVGLGSPLLCTSSYPIIAHRDSLISHLTWARIFLGIHSFGVYIHNDSLECLGRVEDCFGDSCVQLRPLFANYLWGLRGFGLGFGLGSVRGRIYYTWSELGTSDFMVHHVHAFTIHVTVLVLVKGVLNSRGSRLVSDKGSLGFR